MTGAVWLLAAGAHVLGGGTLPAAETSTALIALLLLAVMVVLRRRISMAGMAAVVGIGQVLLHQALSLLSQETPCAASAHGTPQHAAPAVACPIDAHEALMHADPGTAMPVAHVLAAAVTATLLGRAEAALCRLVDWFRPLTRALHPATISLSGLPRSACGSGPVATPWRNHRADGIRGPPVQCVPFTSPL
ncbi:hypothetical protein [Arthrobacter sp. D3-16]